jgi:hypothetical protein
VGVDIVGVDAGSFVDIVGVGSGVCRV